MVNRTWIKTAVLFSSVSLLTGAERVLEDTVTNTLIFRKVALPPQAFNQAAVIQLAREFLAHNPKVKMARLTVVPDMKPAALSLIGCDHCESYKFWRGQWDSMTKENF